MEAETEGKMVDIMRNIFIDREEDSGGLGYRFFHSYRVYKMCKVFLSMNEVSSKNPDEDVLLTVALFHDIGRSKSSDKVMKAVMPGHDEESAKMLHKLLDGVVADSVIKTTAGILHNYLDDNYKSIEKELLSYADDLDEIGALDVWRMFTFAAYNKRTAAKQLDYWKDKESKKYSGAWINRFRIESIKKIAEDRIRTLNDFMLEFDKEFNTIV